MKLPRIIGSNMVLQQAVKVPVWGKAEPGENIQVEFSGQSVSTVTAKDGNWETCLSPLKPGGPYEMKISSGKETIKLENILVGEVWVASGQSNMEMRVGELKNSVEVRKAANYPKIRLFSVPVTVSYSPLEDIGEGSWVECTPETVKDFSAAGYFFAMELNKDMNVPVGIIGSYRGGTRAEAWTDRKTLESLGTYKADLKEIDNRNSEFGVKELEKQRKAWQKACNQDDPGNKGFALGYAFVDFNDKEWDLMKLPTYWEKVGLDMDGSVWFRREVDIPGPWAGKELMLSVGVCDDCDTTYFNGVQVGATGKEVPDSYSVLRKYKVPKELVKTGKNMVAVRVFDYYDEGGMCGPASEMFVSLWDKQESEKIPIAGAWKYKIETVIDRPYLTMANPDNICNHATVLFNGMINPLVNFSVKGVIWYQGESNAGKAEEYDILFPAMIQAWRKAWGIEMPFLFVQLCNCMAQNVTPVENSRQARLRESQLKTLKLKGTGMAVAIDIGSETVIHPDNKYDVGKRLALNALHIAYGKDIVYSGPIFESMEAKGNTIKLFFKHVGSGLVAKGEKELKGFAIAGQDKNFVAADARIEGKNVIVWSREITSPAAVRYAWADNPVCNLYNKEGLPASPFRTDSW